MSPRTGPDPTPRTWLADKHGQWPTDALADEAPVEALAVRETARRTLAAVRARGDDLDDLLSALPPPARRAAGELLSGTGYPDFAGLVALENEFGMRLWPTPSEIPPPAHTS